MNGIEKLPRWAQYEIKKLEQAYDRLKAYVDGESDATSKVVCNHYPHKSGLPEFSTIQFTLEDGSVISVSLDEDGQYVKVYSSDILLVTPRASNVVHVGSKSTQF